MSVKDDIFPAAGGLRHVQTQWSKGWGFTAIGFGEAARLLTEQSARMGATVDSIGLAVFFLQRHRVELIIKGALVDLGEDPKRIAGLPHKLDHLWGELGAVVRRTTGNKDWQYLNDQFGDFVKVMHEADKGSFSYRYPVDKKGEESERAAYIDLDALDRHTDGFYFGVGGYTSMVSEGRQAELDAARDSDPGYGDAYY